MVLDEDRVLPSAADVAAYLLNQTGPLPQMKLHKLLYYCQAWSAVWDGGAMFSDRIEAWVNGPVIPNLWQQHRYEYLITSSGGDASKLGANARDTVNIVLSRYGDRSAAELSALTHSEPPWRNARQGMSANEVSNKIITVPALKEYYSRKA